MKPKAKPDKPDEVFKAPGFRIERRGRFTTIDTHRTPEEHKRFLERIIKSRPLLLDEVQNATQDLLKLVHKFNSLELLAQVWFNNSVMDPNQYKEYSFEGRLHYVEHLSALELKDAVHELRTTEMPGGAEIKKAQELLDIIFGRTLFYYASEALNPEQPGHLSRLDRLRFETIVHELTIRFPTYFSHHADILRAMFGRDFVNCRLEGELGFNIEQALKCVQATSDLMMERLLDRRDKAREFGEQLRTYVEEFKRTGKFTGPDEIREAANQIRNMRGKRAKQTIKGIAVSWAFYNLHDTCSFTASELAGKVQLDLRPAEAFLDKFSLHFGDIPADYLLPQPTSPVRLKPIIKYGEKYFCPAVHLLIWALKPQIEKLLKPGGTDAISSEPKFWERYQRHRSNFLMQRALAYFADLLPRAEVYSNLHYSIVENGVEKVVELDGLVLLDRYAFLIEGKAGEVSPSARRGAHLRLVADLKELVEEPHRQALRARTYITTTERPIFKLGAGTEIHLDKNMRQQFFLITVTLENLDVFTKELFQLKELGIFGESDVPWAISIDDLRIIAETIKVPAQFIQYLKWRLHLNQHIKIVAQSELDWLGYYLAEGPQRLKVPAGYDYMMLETYTTAFDDFYLYEQGERTIPAPRPSQFCPPELMTILASLEALDGINYIAASEAFLDLSFDERKLVANYIRQTHNKAHSDQIEFVGERTVVILTTSANDPKACGTLAQSVAQERGKTTVVLVLTGTERKVKAFGICEIPQNVR